MDIYALLEPFKVNRLLSPLEGELLAMREASHWNCNTDFARGEVITESKHAAGLVSSSTLFLGSECFPDGRNPVSFML